MMYKTILVESSRAIFKITLNRPNHQNSITNLMISELHQALNLAEQDSECKVVTIEGANGIYCTGMDLEEAGHEINTSDTSSQHMGEPFFQLLRRLTEMPKVVIAKVDGRVSGGGIGLVAASDFAFATERSEFSLPEALWGLLPCCVLPFLMRRIGFQKSYTMTLSTLPLNAKQAAQIHLIDDISDNLELQVRKILFRQTKVHETTLSDLKSFFAKLHPIPPSVEKEAVIELSRLMASPHVQNSLYQYAKYGHFPWETATIHDKGN